MINITINYDAYLEETNDPVTRRSEMRIVKKEGPRYIDTAADIDIRIPHSGFTYQGYEFTLVGFGALDVKPMMRPTKKAMVELEKFLGKGIMLIKPPVLQSIYYIERTGGLHSLLTLARQKYGDGTRLGRVQAMIEAVVGMGLGGEPKEEEKPPADEPRKSFEEEMGFSYK